VRNLLEMIYAYQLLTSKERHLDIPLDAGERARRMGLHRLLMGERPDPRRRGHARVKLPMRVQFTRPGGFEHGEIRDLSGGGVCVQTSAPQEPGTRVVLRIEAPRDGVEYVFPCRVVWRSTHGPRRMGLAFDGVPHQSDLYGDESGVWRRTPRFGAVDDTSHVA